ncbi:outer membrane protein assembly factor BamB family protein [Dictyobacter aurantiacus]|uniref:Pyrrolo-quinoline quinone repeat domain-containing protein n=1 Tax=Dictyobacter aurantiacus TaxID=1936993 RepID=A0A401ZS01_9CHLR|nr:PQQ-binding-like beta-propeller repeat protein [Dictyobacter aurantiacus]GCE09582.1 hypothetical protein KDAU_69110 [Dictyobacter aurantiacus]
MDSGPDPLQRDQPDFELEITDIDTDDSGEMNGRSSKSSRLEPLLAFTVRHARILFMLAIVVGCLVFASLLFPDAASFIHPVDSAPPAITPMAPPYSFVTVSGNDNVTFVLGQIENGDQSSRPLDNVGITVYDTHSGALLWHTPQHQLSRTTYGLATNLKGQGEHIYALRADGLISLLDPRSGKTLWSYQLPSTMPEPMAIEQDGVLYLQTSDQAVYAFKDGGIVWRNGQLGTMLTIDNGIIYFYDMAHQRYAAIDENSGTSLWTYTMPPAAQQPSFQSFSLPVIENKTCYVQAINNKVLAIQEGHVLWSRQFHSSVTLKSDTHHLYVVDQSAETLEVLNLQTGRQERTPLPATGVVSIKDIQGNLLYIQTDEGLKAINADTGNVVWQKTLAVSPATRAADGVLYVPIFNNTASVQAISERDGTVLWSGTIKGNIMTIDASVLDLYASDDYTLSVLRLSDGKVLWSKQIE